ncbi:MAG TPA: TlpA disulfide reductase family protein [Pirellulales bacterium]|jgi:thiol-disulfide isomerase/thioredoxin|nr:TlpA disulfide reductase family protein [Pirellulales bacterium]
MRVRHFVLLLVVVTVAVWGCGQSSPPRIEIAQEPAQDNAAAEFTDVSETPGESAEAALPDNARDLIALIQQANEQRKSHGADNSRHNYFLSHEHQAAVARVLAAGKKLREIATADDRKPDGYDEAIGVWLLYRTAHARPGDFDSLLADLHAYFAAGPAPTAAAAEAAARAAQKIVFSDEARALALCRQSAPILSQSDDATILSYAAKLEGIARGLDLLGHTLEIRGTTVDGKPFDLAELRGKIVLVDFFTTWCGPCRAELPNVRSTYERDHDRGFEVVTISLDDDRDALDAFLKAEPVPWTMLYDGPWSDNPNATYYGVSGVPDLILIDQQGTVVSSGWQGTSGGPSLPNCSASMPKMPPRPAPSQPPIVPAQRPRTRPPRIPTPPEARSGGATSRQASRGRSPFHAGPGEQGPGEEDKERVDCNLIPRGHSYPGQPGDISNERLWGRF